MVRRPRACLSTWEIINPHDKAFVDGDDESAVLIAVIGLGAGAYGAEEQGTDRKIPVMLLWGASDLDAFVKERHGCTFDALPIDRLKVAAVLDSLRYERERTSTVDMKAKAEHLAASLRREHARGAPT